MSNTFTQVAVFAFAALVTTITVVGTNAIATQQYVKADAAALTHASMEIVQRKLASLTIA